MTYIQKSGFTYISLEKLLKSLFSKENKTLNCPSALKRNDVASNVKNYPKHLYVLQIFYKSMWKYIFSF